jgi:hypothetical protein
MLGALTATVLVVAGAGCGSSDSYENASRPPSPVDVSVQLTDQRVLASPTRLGAGPVTLLVSNQSTRTRELTLTAPTDSGRGCIDDGASSGPIGPQGTARLQLSLVQGTCVVGVADDALQPRRLTVGAERPSAQDDLLQP